LLFPSVEASGWSEAIIGITRCLQFAGRAIYRGCKFVESSALVFRQRPSILDMPDWPTFQIQNPLLAMGIAVPVCHILTLL
jgi:hypothetical protein